MEQPIVNLLKRVQTGSKNHLYAFPSADRYLQPVINSLDLEEEDDKIFLDVWQWMANALGSINIHLHDMIAFPIQFAHDTTKAHFAQMGFAMDEAFSADDSRAIARLLQARLPARGQLYLSLALNATVKLVPQRRTNFVSDMWSLEGVIIPTYHNHWHSELSGVVRVLQLASDGAPAREYERLLNALMSVTDPLRVLQDVSGHLPANEPNLRLFRQSLVFNRWRGRVDVIEIEQEEPDEDKPPQVLRRFIPNYSAFLLAMMQYDAYIRNRDDPDMTVLFVSLMRGIAGPPHLLLTEVLSANIGGSDESVGTQFIPERFVFAGIQMEQSEMVIETVAHYGVSGNVDEEDAIAAAARRRAEWVEGNRLLQAAVQMWTRHHVTNPRFYPSWGEELLYYVLSEGVVDRFSIIVDNVPNGKIPRLWIDGAVQIASDKRDAAVFRKVVDTLINYGMMNPKSFRIGEARVSLTELAAENESIEEMEERFKHALKRGAPFPSETEFLSWQQPAQITFGRVTDAIDILFRARS